MHNVAEKMEKLSGKFGKQGMNLDTFKTHFEDLFRKRQNMTSTRGSGAAITRKDSNADHNQVLSAIFPKSHRIAVIFACDDYTESLYEGKCLKNLNCAVEDAKLFKETIEKLGFETFKYQINEDCTSQSLKSTFNELIDKFTNDYENSEMGQFIFY